MYTKVLRETKEQKKKKVWNFHFIFSFLFVFFFFLIFIIRSTCFMHNYESGKLLQQREKQKSRKWLRLVVEVFLFAFVCILCIRLGFGEMKIIKGRPLLDFSFINIVKWNEALILAVFVVLWILYKWVPLKTMLFQVSERERATGSRIPGG